MTKELARSGFNQKLAAQLKDKMAVHLQQCKAVWQAFEKFIHAKCNVQGKTVDTQIAGLFRRHQGQVQFLPQLEFLFAGKFKPQKSMGNGEQYAELLAAVKTVSSC